MSSSQTIVDFVLEQASGAGPLRAKKMFGEYAIYRTGQMIAMICDDRLFVKPTDAGRAVLGAPVEGIPYRNAKPHFLIGQELMEDRDLLAALLIATDENLPPPETKAPSRARRKKKPS